MNLDKGPPDNRENIFSRCNCEDFNSKYCAVEDDCETTEDVNYCQLCSDDLPVAKNRRVSKLLMDAKNENAREFGHGEYSKYSDSKEEIDIQHVISQTSLSRTNSHISRFSARRNSSLKRSQGSLIRDGSIKGVFNVLARSGSKRSRHESVRSTSSVPKHIIKSPPQNRRFKLAWFFKESWFGKSGFKLKPIERLYKSVDNLQYIDSSGVSKPFTNTDPYCGNPRLVSSAYKINDFAGSRAMSLYGVRSQVGIPSANFRYGQPGSKSDMQERMLKGLLRPIRRKDIYYSGSVNHLSAYRHYGGSLTTFMAAMTRSSSEGDSDVITADARRTNESAFCRTVKSCLPMHLFTNLQFMLLLVTFTMWTGESCP